MKQKTINDVAKLARVSKGTVSKVINNQGYISKETREKVSKAIKELDYVPNKTAQNLGKRTSGLIGFMYPIQGNEAVLAMYRGAVEEANKHGHTVVAFETNFDLEKEAKVFELYTHGGLDGLLIVSCATPFSELLNLKNPNNIVLFQENEQSQFSSVTIDFQKLLKELVPYVKKQNKNFGIVIGKRSMRNQVKDYMIQAYKEITEDSDLDNVITNRTQYENGYKAGLEFLSKENVPDIIWTDENENGAGVKKAYLESGRKEPLIISMGVRALGKYAGLSMIDGKAIEAGKLAYYLIGEPLQSLHVEVDFKFEI